MIAAILRPLHGHAGTPRRERDQKVLGVEFASCAETTADVQLDHVDAGFRQVHQLGENAPGGERRLGCALHDHALRGCIPFGQQRARLHRHGCVAMHIEGFTTGVFRCPESRFGVPDSRGVGDGDIGAMLLEHDRIACDGRSQICHRRHLVDLKHDGIPPVLGECCTRGQNDGDRLADETHPLLGDHRSLEQLELGQREQSQRHTRHRCPDVGRHDDAVHARNREGGTGIELADRAVCNGAP